MPEDIFNIEILEDGTIKSTTPKISASNHANANQFMQMIARLAGGATDIKHRDKTTDHHHHDHEAMKGQN